MQICTLYLKVQTSITCICILCNEALQHIYPVSILYKSIAGRYRPVRVADGPITARYRFIKNASWVVVTFYVLLAFTLYNIILQSGKELF